MSTLRTATNLGQMAMTVQDTGSGPSLDDVTVLLDARLRLRGAYNDMAREVKTFINTDTMFIQRQRFYDELVTLTRTTSDAVDEALFMSGEYLSDIADVEGIFHNSAAACSQLSLQIARLTNKGSLK